MNSLIYFRRHKYPLTKIFNILIRFNVNNVFSSLQNLNKTNESQLSRFIEPGIQKSHYSVLLSCQLLNQLYFNSIYLSKLFLHSNKELIIN